MGVRHEVITVTGPAGTVVSDHPVHGEVVEVRVDGQTLNTSPAGSADLTITRVADTGTILADTNISFPEQWSPRQLVNLNTTGGTLSHQLVGGAVNPQVGPVYATGYLQAVIAQAGTASADVRVYYRT